MAGSVLPRSAPHTKELGGARTAVVVLLYCTLLHLLQIWLNKLDNWPVIIVQHLSHAASSCSCLTSACVGLTVT